MTPAARVQAAIEILDLVIAAARNNGAPADRIVSDWFRTRRFAGSKDRRAVRDLVYNAIRACGDFPQSGRAAMLRLAADDPALISLFDGSVYGPASLDPEEPVAAGGIAPAWLEERLAASDIAGEEAAALLERAPLDVRINTLRADVVILPEGGRADSQRRWLSVSAWHAHRGHRHVSMGRHRSAGRRLATGLQGGCSAVARLGYRPVRWCGRQVARACGASRHSWQGDRLRYRPGAAFAPRRSAQVGPGPLASSRRGCSIRAASCRRWTIGGAAPMRCLSMRPVRAPAHGAAIPKPAGGSRREWLADVTALQARLLDVAAELVRPGGALVYVTCSLLDEEGADQASAFLARHEGWEAQPLALGAGTPRGQGLRLSPFRDGTDGFFIARLLRIC